MSKNLTESQQGSINSLFAGFDMDSRYFTSSVVDFFGKKLTQSKLRFNNNLTGFKEFVNHFFKILSENPQIQRIVFAAESTNVYHLPLLYYLSTHRELNEKYKIEVHQLTPVIIKKYRESLNQTNVNDYSDSYVIADRIRIGNLPAVSIFDGKKIALQQLTRSRYQYTKEITRIKNWLMPRIFLKYTQMTQERIFSDVFSKTSLEIINGAHTADDIVNMEIEELVEMIIKTSKKHIKEPEELAQKIVTIAKDNVYLDREIRESTDLIISSNIELLTKVKDQIKQIDKKITEMINKYFAEEYNIIRQIKGIGPVYAAGIIAEVGDIQNYRSSNGIAKISGLVWKSKKSGKYESEENPAIPGKNKYLKYYLVEAANSVRKWNEGFQKYYEKKYNEVKKHQHKRANVLTARKLLRVIYAIWKNKTTYNPDFDYHKNYQKREVS